MNLYPIGVGSTLPVGEYRLHAVRFIPDSPSKKREAPKVATDYDELRSDVKESQDNSLEQLQSANAPDARSVVQELDEADGLDGAGVPGGEFVAEELVVQVIPQAEDEFTCYSCFLVRHRSQIARQKDGHSYCTECEG
jgi:hypothetical protein